MKIVNNLSLILVVLVSSLFVVSCGDDEEPTTMDQTIVEIASETEELSSLVAALQRAELVSVLSGDGPFTVFAPTNDAFDQFLSSNGFDALEDVPVDVLTQVLLNHVVNGNFDSGSLSNGYVKTNAAESTTANNIDMYIDVTNGVSINGQSSVTQADINASNGIVHLVSDVIALPTVVSFATADDNFATLTTALTRNDLPTDFVSALTAEGPYTVFAPVNDAFTALLEELGVNGLEDIDAATLDAVLKYHVASGANVLSTALTDDMSVATLANVNFTIDLDNGAEIVDNRGRRTSIIITDVQASNGVIHALNRVILP